MLRSFISLYATEGLIVLLALAIYLPAITWGLPEGVGPLRVRPWTVDSLGPISALAEMHHTVLAPTENRWLAYPLFHHMILCAAFVPYFAWLWLTGGFTAPAAEYPFGFTDPVSSLRNLDLIARMVSIFMAAGTAILMYRIGRALWSRSAGMIAALVMLLLYTSVYYARTSNLETGFLFWITLGFWCYARIVQHGINWRWAALLGLSAGAATGTKELAAGFFVFMPIALLFKPLESATIRGTNRMSALALALLCAVIGFGVASGFVLSPERYIAHLKWMAQNNPDPPYHARFPATYDGYAQFTVAILQSLWRGAGMFLLIASALGGWLLLRRRPQALVLLLPAVGYLLTMVLPMRRTMIRYLLPMIPVLTMLAVCAFEVARSKKSHSVPANEIMGGPALDRHPHGLVAWLARIACILALTSSLAYAVDLTYQMKNDSRFAASTYLLPRVASGDRVAYFESPGELPYLTARARLVEIPPGDAAIDFLADTQPEIIVIIPNWTSADGMDHPATCTPELYARLFDRSLGYYLGNRFQTPSLLGGTWLDYPAVNPPVHVFLHGDTFTSFVDSSPQGALKPTGKNDPAKTVVSQEVIVE